MTIHLVAAAVHGLPALVWGVVAWHLWRLRRDVGIESPALRVGAALAVMMMLHFVLHAAIELTPTELGGRLPGLHAVLETAIGGVIIAALAIFRHMLLALARGPGVATPGWLALNYGAAALTGVVAIGPALAPGWNPALRWAAVNLVPDIYGIVMSALVLRQTISLAHRGGWRPGPATGQLRSPDLLVVGGALLGTGALLLMLVATGSAAPATAGGLFLHTAIGVGLALPFVVRMLGRVMRTFVIAAVLIAATVAVAVGTSVLAARAPDPETARLIELGGAGLLLLVLVPGRTGLEAVVERAIFRRSRHHEEELQAFVRRLPPELGVREYCRRTLAEITRVAGLRAAAIVLPDGSAVVDGDFALAPLERAWPRDGAGALPIGTVTIGQAVETAAEPLRTALLAAEVAWIVPIRSPRRTWGHLFAREWLVTAPGTVAGITAFVGQLALVLDAADLLARSVAVERSLAHAEKLAAIGELAARIAHDIRNPVTAARSLAQQLVTEPFAPFAEEHALILGELERVERRIAALLRFARREELDCRPVDLAELVAGTATALGARLAADGIVLTVDGTAGVTVCADRERIRHVLVNLIENSADALRDTAGERRIEIAIGRADGMATVMVRDTGPGVPDDALPRLFEPFFSLKPTGTGLGLAIARRTIEAHGGRIAARSTARGGMAVDLALPLASGEALPS